MSTKQRAAKIIVESLHNAGVKVVFGIPGAKIDAVFDELLDHPNIKLIVCRHEQNAVFMAAAIGRITGIPGVCVATSGPGASNLTTGLVTATTEGDPVVAIVGSVPRAMSTKHTHQSMKALEILKPVTKSAIGIAVEDQAAEVVLSSFRHAASVPRGATVFDLPADIATATSGVLAFPPEAFKPPSYGPAPPREIAKAVEAFNQAKLPILFLGQRASSPVVVAAVRSFLQKHPIPVIETFQAAGAISKDLAEQVFYGRVGLFRNQVGDRLLAASDLVITLGYDPAEYDANAWNPEGKLKIMHIDNIASEYDAYYKPSIELIGSISESLLALSVSDKHKAESATETLLRGLRSDLISWSDSLDRSTEPNGLVQPLQFVSALQKRTSADTTVTCDIGTVYIYMMRYFNAYEPRRLLCSNGQQTLGVGMPWAIAASLAQEPPCSQKVISLSGDGGFMFSVQELSTAVQQGCNITHFIWNSYTYNMVEFQAEMKYGRTSGIELGGVDFVKLAEAFGAKGFRVKTAGELESVMDEALKHKGVALVDIEIDYSHSADLAAHLIKDSVG